ncbi:MAG TPA: radical SAM/SPASM domain-containing protein [Candidatus Omnitrophota bacterium]|nr:radical SAM/SPASM domain-containing protein [Candidatus Omnitrophota bacterium]
MIKRAFRYSRMIGRYMRGYCNAKNFVPAEIPRLSLEVTNVCDSACVFCANGSVRRKREPMDMGLFRKAVDEYVSWGGRKLDFNTVIGEPLMDPFLIERLRYVRSYDQLKTVGFVTNLQWLHKFSLDDFVRSGITWLAVSIVLSGKEKYRASFGVDRYDQVIENLINLIDINKKNNSPLAILLSLKPTGEKWQSVVLHEDFKRIESLGSFGLQGQARNSGFVDDWAGAVALPGFLHRRPFFPRFFRPCRCLYDSMAVFSNGAIGLCTCRDKDADSDLILGNIRSTSLAEAWTGQKAGALRDAWRGHNTVPMLCRRCTHYLY